MLFFFCLFFSLKYLKLRQLAKILCWISLLFTTPSSDSCIFDISWRPLAGGQVRRMEFVILVHRELPCLGVSGLQCSHDPPSLMLYQTERWYSEHTLATCSHSLGLTIKVQPIPWGGQGAVGRQEPLSLQSLLKHWFVCWLVTWS